MSSFYQKLDTHDNFLSLIIYIQLS